LEEILYRAGRMQQLTLEQHRKAPLICSMRVVLSGSRGVD
jgi:hypothetical protein